jgi:hypothetical protein
MVTTSTDARATTILQGSANWTPWYAAKRRYATIKGVWQYCDPDSATKSPLPVTEPSDDDPAGTWKIWVIKSRSQESIQKAIGEVNLKFLRTVAMTYIHLIDGAEHDDPQSQLMTLRKHFKVTDQQRRLELATQYSDIQKKPKNQRVQAWLDEYSQITSQCAQEGMPEMTETRAQWRFIPAVRDSGDEAWAQAQFLVMEQGKPHDLWPTPTLQDLISCYWRTGPREHPKKNRSRCACRLHLSVLQCFTLNPEAKYRPKDFKPSPKALSQLVEPFRNKDTLKKAKKAYKNAGIQ